MKKTVSILLAVLLMFVTFNACDGRNNRARTVTDLKGNTVSIPDTVNFAASNSASVTSQIVLLAGSDAVKIAPASFESGHTEFFSQVFEGTNDIPLATGNTISAETLIAQGVTVFFTTKQPEAEEYANSGLTAVVLNLDTVESIAQSFLVMGEVFGGEAFERAKKISANLLNCKQIVTEATDKTPVQDRPEVYYISASTQTSPYLTQGKGTSTNTLLEMCGATHITSGTGIDVTVNTEFLLQSNPEYILIDGYLASEAYDNLVNDPVLKNLTAVKEGKIIIAPIGLFRPWLRPFAETGLGLIWLAKTFCSEQMKDVSLEEIAIEFYKDCFGLDYSADDITNMLNWAG